MGELEGENPPPDLDMSAFGLDIGSHSIKVVQLLKEGKTVRLVAAGIATSPPRGLQSDSPRDLIMVSETIRKLVGDTKINNNQVVFALPESAVFTRLISFPPLSDEEVASAVEWQAEGYIPIPKKDAELDWEIVKKDERGVEVLLIAAPKAIVNKYLKVVGNANLVPVAVETELIALTRSLAPTSGVSLLVDFGATSTDIAIAVNRQLVFSRSSPTAGEALTRAVAQGIGVESSQAEEYKKTYGLTSSLEGKVKQALSPLISSIIEELKKTREFWLEEHPDLPVTTVILAGGTTGLPEIGPTITEALGMEVTIGNPFSFVALDPRVAKTITPYAPLYGISVGLAMRDL